MREYGPDFYRYMASFAVRSAQRIVPLLAAALTIRSVADFGCGHGAWLSVWADAGASVVGIDGAYVDAQQLLIDRNCFSAADLTGPIELGRQFDLVQSLEVAEHLPPASAERFVDTLVRHGSCVLFSAATPGQGGEHHVNEQPLQYWRALFHNRGYAAIDYLRPIIVGDVAIAPWYRYNTLLYATDDRLASLPERVRACRVPNALPLRDYRPLPYRMRSAVIRRLPPDAVDRMSRARAALAARIAKI